MGKLIHFAKWAAAISNLNLTQPPLPLLQIVLPSLLSSENGHIVLFVPNYYDFVRVRNALLRCVYNDVLVLAACVFFIFLTYGWLSLTLNLFATNSL